MMGKKEASGVEGDSGALGIPRRRSLSHQAGSLSAREEMATASDGGGASDADAPDAVSPTSAPPRDGGDDGNDDDAAAASSAEKALERIRHRRKRVQRAQSQREQGGLGVGADERLTSPVNASSTASGGVELRRRAREAASSSLGGRGRGGGGKSSSGGGRGGGAGGNSGGGRPGLGASAVSDRRLQLAAARRRSSSAPARKRGQQGRSSGRGAGGNFSAASPATDDNDWEEPLAPPAGEPSAALSGAGGALRSMRNRAPATRPAGGRGGGRGGGGADRQAPRHRTSDVDGENGVGAATGRKGVEAATTMPSPQRRGRRTQSAGDASKSLPVSAAPPKSLDALVASSHGSAAGSDSGDDPDRAFLSDPHRQAAAANAVMEHRIFLRAILQLLTERDQFAVEADVNDPITIKSGPLKKASHLVRGVWKVKYVEIRRGLFSYYEDTTTPGGGNASGDRLDAAEASFDSGDGTAVPGMGDATAAPPSVGNSSDAAAAPRRKSVPLRANACTCRAVKVSHKALSPGGAIFELTVEGGPRRLWMANSREERQAWIHAVHEAMIGRSVTRGDNFLEYQVERKQGIRGGEKKGGSSGAVPMRSPYKNDLEQYVEVQGAVKKSNTREAYMRALSALMIPLSLAKTSGMPTLSPPKSLDVPVQWIKEQVEVASGGASGNTRAFREEGVSTGIAQLWKDMARDSITINGELYKGDAGHGPERIVGGLTRCIVSHDRSAPQNASSGAAYRRKFGITEAQAVSYARDVLLACNRTRSGGDSYYCVDHLCSNPDLVVLCPSTAEAEPLKIVVRHTLSSPSADSPKGENKDGENDGDDDDRQKQPLRRESLGHSVNDMSGWILTRARSSKPWKRRFAVLSEGVLSYYEHAAPRPHGLRGQLLLAGATVGVSQVGDDDDGSEEENESGAKDVEGNPGGAGTAASPSHADSSKKKFGRIQPSSAKYVVCIVAKSGGSTKERQIRFDDQTEFFLWNQSLRDSVQKKQGGKAQSTAANSTSLGGGGGGRAISRLAGSLKQLPSPRRRSDDAREPTPVPRPIPEDSLPSSDRAPTSPPTIGSGSGSLGATIADLGNGDGRDDSLSAAAAVSPTSSEAPWPGHGSGKKKKGAGGSTNWNKVKGGRARSTVEISVEASAVYKICTTDPQGEEREDTWAMLQTRFLQNFRLSGGPNGRIMRGEEIVQMNFMEGLVDDDAFSRVLSRGGGEQTKSAEAGLLLKRISSLGMR